MDKFARLLLVLDTPKPIETSFSIDGWKQLVEYENLNKVCFACGIIGHSQDRCHTTLYGLKPMEENIHKFGPSLLAPP